MLQPGQPDTFWMEGDKEDEVGGSVQLAGDESGEQGFGSSQAGRMLGDRFSLLPCPARGASCWQCHGVAAQSCAGARELLGNFRLRHKLHFLLFHGTFQSNCLPLAAGNGHAGAAPGLEPHEDPGPLACDAEEVTRGLCTGP